MANPITWQNVNAPSNDGALRAMELARQSGTAAFDKFGSIITDREVGAQKIEDRADSGRVQTMLDRIQAAATNAQMAELQASGELDAMRASITNPENQALVRGAAEARTTSNQSREKAGWEFANAGEEQKFRPHLGTLASLAQQNKPEEMKAYADQNGVPQHLMAKIWEQSRTVGNAQAAASIAANTDARAATRQTADIENMTRDDVRADAQLRINQQQQTQSTKNSDAVIASRLEKELADTKLRIAAPDTQSVSGEKGLGFLLKGITDNTEKGSTNQKELLQIAAKVAKDPKNAGMPASLLLPHILSHKTGTLWGDNYDNLQKSLESVQTEFIAGKETRESNRQGDIDHAKLLTDALRPYYGGGAGGATATATAGSAPAAPGAAPNQPGAVQPGAVAAPVPANAAKLDEKAKEVATAARDNDMLARQTKLEQEGKQLGAIKEFSPEVKEYLAKQSKDEKAAIAADRQTYLDKELQRALGNGRATARPGGVIDTSAMQKADYLRRVEQLNQEKEAAKKAK